MSTRQAGETRSSAVRALALLSAFDDRHRSLTLTSLARRAGLPLSTAHRLLAELTEARLLVRRPDQAYEIGARIWHLGLLSPQTALREAALPHMQDLVAATGHTAHLAVLDGTRALVLERLAGTRSLPTRHSPGRFLPLHCTGVGKALLAHAPAPIRTQVLAELAPHTAHTVTDPRTLGRQLEQVRRSGVARSAQEHRLGVFSLAMPIVDHSGLVAALGLLAPVSSPWLSSTVKPLRDAAAAVASSLRRTT